MARAREVVAAFQQAVGQKDFDAARNLLRDDLEFHGPIDTFRKADDYVRALAKLSSIVEGVEVRKLFEDGDDVCVLYDMSTRVAGTSFVSEWFHLEGGKIATVRVVFDARPFAAMFAKPAS